MNYSKPPIQTPFLDDDGRVTQAWYLFLNNIYTSLSNGQSNATLLEILGIALQALTQKDPDIQQLSRKISEIQILQVQSPRFDPSSILMRLEEIEYQIQSIPKVDISQIARQVEDLRFLVNQLTQRESIPKVSVQQFEELRNYVFGLLAHP